MKALYYRGKPTFLGAAVLVGVVYAAVKSIGGGNQPQSKPWVDGADQLPHGDAQNINVRAPRAVPQSNNVEKPAPPPPPPAPVKQQQQPAGNAAPDDWPRDIHGREVHPPDPVVVGKRASVFDYR